jgi:hypothetical protein
MLIASPGSQFRRRCLEAAVNFLTSAVSLAMPEGRLPCLRGPRELARFIRSVAGPLTPVPGSPFATGTGSAGVAQPTWCNTRRITICARVVGEKIKRPLPSSIVAAIHSSKSQRKNRDRLQAKPSRPQTNMPISDFAAIKSLGELLKR